MTISGISPILVPPAQSPEQSSPGTGEFRDILKSALEQVESSRSQANAGVERFLTGEGDDLHSTILAVQRADLEFEMLMQVRNKVVAAYQEIMRMQM
jgi:flagellar hook-basal body complex protein FliE